MGPLGNAILGVVFLFVGAGGTFLMFHLWGYSFDHETRKSEAPPPLMRLHRALGWVYLLLYIYFMWQMVPRLWSYQIEFPARTVAHLTLGMTIGAILLVKVAIVRFFKHLESALVPLLGTAMFICTILLIGLSAPFAFREAYLRASSVEGNLIAEENLERVRSHLKLAGLEDEAMLSELSTPQALTAGQTVLTTHCIQCHDLRTVLVQPRTPQNWRLTVQRMAERSSFLSPISEDEEWHVTAYLIAISPELQRSVRERRVQQQQGEESARAVEHLAEQAAAEAAALGAPDQAPAEEYDEQRARGLYESRCSLCHSLENVENAPPGSEEETRAVVARMVGYGLSGTEEELSLIIRYVTETYAN